LGLSAFWARFAGEYYMRFGEKPSETLQRALGQSWFRDGEWLGGFVAEKLVMCELITSQVQLGTPVNKRSRRGCLVR